MGGGGAAAAAAAGAVAGLVVEVAAAAFGVSAAIAVGSDYAPGAWKGNPFALEIRN